MKNKKTLQITVLLIIGLSIAGIWALKNAPTTAEVQTVAPVETVALSAAEGNSHDTAAFEDGETASVAQANEDFALEAKGLDVEQLLTYQLPIIIDFGADSCVPCKEMAPVLKTLNEEMRGRAIIKFIDVWKNPRAASSFPVQVIPTQVFYNADGTPYTPGDAAQQSGLAFTMYQSKTSGKHVMTVHQGGLTEADMRLILGEMGVVQ